MSRSNRCRAKLGLTSLERRDAPAIVPIGFEFRVNTTTGLEVDMPTVALDGDGDFVVAWQAFGFDGDNNAVLARRYSRTGSPLGHEFQVNTFTTGSQQNPRVAADALGNFIVVWGSASGQDGSREGVFARRYTASGAAVDPVEFQINQYTSNIQGAPAVSMNGAGDFVVSWETNAQDGDGYGIYARKYLPTGAPATNEFQVNSTTPGDQRRPSVALSNNGTFAVVWESPDDAGYGIYAQRFNAAANPIGSEFMCSTETLADQTRPRVAIADGGQFAVVWHTQTYLGDDCNIHLRRFDPTGTPQGDEFRVNSWTTGDQCRPAISSNAAGELAVTWQSKGQDGNSGGVFGQRISSAGQFIDGEFRVTTSTEGDQSMPAVASDPYGDFVVAWISRSSPLDGVLAQIYAKPPAPHATVTIDDGSDQRSSVRSLTLTFNTLVNIAPGGITLNGPVGNVGLTYDYSQSTTPYTVVKLTFSGNSVADASLIDGRYTLTFNSSLVTNYDYEGYDGDDNGLPGPSQSIQFHRLFGDINGDMTVNSTDFLQFRLRFLSTNTQAGFSHAFDFNNDGIVDSIDFLQFRLRFLQTI